VKKSVAPTFRLLILSIFLLGAFFSVTWKYISTGLEADGSRMSTVILLLFIYGVIQSFRLAIRVTAEMKHLERLDRLRDPAAVKGELGQLFKDSLALIEQGDQINWSEMMSHYRNYFLGSIRGISVISGVLITAGLLGTVIGLIVTVTGISSVLNAVGQDYDMMISGLNQTVEGMGSAFYTTFFGGLLGGVLLRVLSTENARSAAQLIARCEQLGARWITPLSQRAGRSSSSELEVELAEAKRVLSHFSQEVEAIGQSITGSRTLFEGQLQEVLDKTQASFSTMVSGQMDELSSALKGITNLIQEGYMPLRESMEQSQQMFADAVSSHMADLTDGLNGITAVVEAGRAPLQAELDRLTEGVARAVDATEEVVARASRTGDDQRVRQANELADRLRQAAALLSEVAEGESTVVPIQGEDGAAA
jgi:hypothetical protein